MRSSKTEMVSTLRATTLCRESIDQRRAGQMVQDEVKPIATTACVIWLHGDGESGKIWHKRFKEGVSKIRMPWVEFTFPDAPEGWFDVAFPVREAPADAAPQLDSRVAKLHAELANLEATRGIPASRVVLGGCGPGAALALLAGRTYGKQLAGIACIGGWLLRPNDAASSAAR